MDGRRLARYIITAVSTLTLAGCLSRGTVTGEEPFTLAVTEPTVGIGLLQVSLNEDIPLYRDMDSPVPMDTLRFGRVSTGELEGQYTMSTGRNLDIRPYRFYPGDSVEGADFNVRSGLVYFHPELIFTVTEHSAEGFRVVLDRETWSTAVIRRDGVHEFFTEGLPYWAWRNAGGIWFLYEPWEQYLRRMVYITAESATPLYDRPDGDIIGEVDSYGRALEVEGQWLSYGIKRSSRQPPEPTGWLRWTDGRQMLVGLTPEVYE